MSRGITQKLFCQRFHRALVPKDFRRQSGRANVGIGCTFGQSRQGSSARVCRRDFPHYPCCKVCHPQSEWV